MVFQNPLAQPGLVLVQGQVPVLGLAHHGLAAADGALGVDEVGGAEAGAALFALVAVCSLGVTVGTFAGDVAVGQELVRFLVIILHGGLFDELALVIQGLEELGSQSVMGLRGGARIDIERDAELAERFLYQRVIAVHHVLRGDAFFLGADGDGHSVFVGSADEQHVLFLEAQIAHVDVGRDIHACQVTDVYRAVCIGQSGGNGGSFEFIFHI